MLDSELDRFLLKLGLDGLEVDVFGSVPLILMVEGPFPFISPWSFASSTTSFFLSAFPFLLLPALELGPIPTPRLPPRLPLPELPVVTVVVEVDVLPSRFLRLGAIE